MASKAVTLAFTVVIVAVLVFLILWFLNTRKTQETQNYVSPISTIEHDISNFVNSVKNGFADVLSAGERLAGKFLGWGERELSNTVGIIEHGISNVEKGTESFVKDVYNTIGLGGILKGLPNIERPILREFEKFEKGRANVGKEIEKGIENIPREIYGGVGQVEKYVPEIPANIEKGVEGFVNDIKILLKRF